MNKLAPDYANYISWKCDLSFYKMIGIGGLIIHECKRQIKNKSKSTAVFTAFQKFECDEMTRKTNYL